MDASAFCGNLLALARMRRKRIILPESADSRILQAATAAAHFADILLLGDPGQVARQARQQGITLPPDIRILPPSIEKHIPPLLRLRPEMTAATAQKTLQNPVAMAAVMLKCGEGDGMVAGAAATSGEVLRPTLQIIGPATAARVSSLFFMCFPHEVKIFADCAVNIQPDAGQLADIAVHSAHTAQAFGISPTVALLSYITGDGGGDEGEKVRRAAALAREKLGDIPLAGPIQYDAAVNPDIARRKAPQWAAAGRANVLIFPDLASGNIAYKAVQHAADITAIGPVLQGLRLPVNDLSRGASVEDIIHTIALTAVQAQSAEKVWGL